MYEDWGEFFDHVPPACAALAEWLWTPPELREDDEKTLKAWCEKHGHSTSWAARTQSEPEFMRLMKTKGESFGFSQAHMNAVWGNYYRLASNGNDFRAARNFLIDTHQIKPDAPAEPDPDADGAPTEDELVARHLALLAASKQEENQP